MNKLLIYFSLFFLAVLTAFHGFSQSFEVAPVRIHFQVEPGESQTRTVTVKNHGNRTETINLRFHDFLVQRQGRMEVLPAGSTRNSISNWVNANPTFLELQPNESRTVQLNLQAPADDYSAKWGILSFFTAAEQTVFSADRDLQTGLSLSGRIDIYLNYNPKTDRPGNVEISNLQEADGDDPSLRYFTVNLDNLSEIIVPCRLFLVASNLVTAEEERFRTIEVTTYPQTARTVEMTIPNNLPPGRYSLAAILDYPGSVSLKGTQIIIDVE